MSERNFENPFGQRPWTKNVGAAAVSARLGRGIEGVVAGAFTGAIEICVTYPFEFVKTQLQLDERGTAKRYNGILDCIRQTFEKRGFFGLYRGLSILFYGTVPKSATRFGSFEYLREFFVDEVGRLSHKSKIICGMGAGICEATLVVTPMETIKVKFISDQRSVSPQYKDFFHGVKKMIDRDGLAGIYKGLVPTVLKQSSNQGIRFFIMENLKDMYKGEDREKRIPKPIVGVFGAIAGAVSALGNTPLDVVKTRMQGLDSAKYKSTADCISKILKNEGVLAFYKGTIPRLTRVCLDVAITFMIYDSIKEIPRLYLM